MNQIDFAHASKALKREKRVVVLLPDACHQQSAPVCYLLHGFGGSRWSWLRDARGKLREVLEGIPRFAYVMPESGRRWFIDDFENYRYGTYLLEELIPAVEALLPGTHTRDQRFIGGFSMGGAAAVFQAMRRPDLFAGAFAHAGAFYGPRREGDPYAAMRTTKRLLIPDVACHEAVWGPPRSATRAEYDPERLMKELSERGAPTPRFHLDVGVGDHPRMLKMVHDMRDKLRACGLPCEYAEHEGEHDSEFVARALPSALRFSVSLLPA